MYSSWVGTSAERYSPTKKQSFPRFWWLYSFILAIQSLKKLPEMCCRRWVGGRRGTGCEYTFSLPLPPPPPLFFLVRRSVYGRVEGHCEQFRASTCSAARPHAKGERDKMDKVDSVLSEAGLTFCGARARAGTG